MKSIILTLLMTGTFALTMSATNPVTEVESKTIDPSKSTVVWTGKKVTGQHTGTINIKSGSFDFENGTLVGGAISIDMNTIKCTDLGEGGAQKLEGHLKSDDFFGVPNHPTADLKITGVTMNKEKGNYNLMADITIKGKTKSITFPANITDNEASATVVIDRTDFDVRHGSGSFFDNLGDKTIYDDFELVINLKY